MLTPAQTKAILKVLPSVLGEIGALLTRHTPSDAAIACALARAHLVLGRRAEHNQLCGNPGCRLRPKPEMFILGMAALRNAMMEIDKVAYSKMHMWEDVVPHLNRNLTKRARRIEVFTRVDANFKFFLEQEDKMPCMCTSCCWQPVASPPYTEVLEMYLRNGAGTGPKGLNLLPSTAECAVRFLHRWLEAGGGVRHERTNVAALLWLALTHEQNGFRNAAGKRVHRADIAAAWGIGEETVRKCSDEIARQLAPALANRA